MKSLIRFMWVALVCAGCIGLPDTGHDFNSENIKKLKVGETTESQVLELFGKPNNRVRNSDGTTVLSYQYMHSDQIVHPFSALTADGLKSKYKMKMVTVILDSDGKVKNFTESQSDE